MKINDTKTNKQKKKEYLLITKSTERLNRILTTKSSPLLPSLWRFSNRMGMFKQVRADFLRNVVSFLIESVAEVEMSTLNIGKFYNRKDGTVDFYNEGIEHFANKIGVCNKTIMRIISALEHAGYMKSKKMGAINSRGEFVKYNTLRTLTKKLFIELGISGEEVDNGMNYKRKFIQNKFKGSKLSDKCQRGLKRIQQTLNHFLDNKKQSPLAATVKRTIPPSKTRNLLDQCNSIAEYKTLLARQ